MNADDLAVEALKLSGTRERFSGVVSKIVGTTTFIKSGDREFLAWSRPDLTVGATVELAIDQLRAKNIRKIPTA